VIARARPARRLALLLLLVPALAACHSWRPATLAPRALIAAEQPGVVRVTRANGSVVEIEGPAIVGDSIVGTGEGGPTRAAAADVTFLEVRHVSIPKTLALLVSHASAAISFVAFVIEIQPHYRGLF
jgi:hypothetical protein